MAHYVNNKEMLSAIKEYRDALKSSEQNGTAQPRIPEYLGECILKIATNLARKPNFIGYSYKDDMISDGIENCVMCIGSFDPDKSSNPFAYFTQVIYFAFIRRIQKEKKQTYIRSKIIQEMPMPTFDTQDHDDDSEFVNSYMDFMREHQEFDDSFMRKKEEAKEKRKQKQIETENSLLNFVEDEEDEDSDNY